MARIAILLALPALAAAARGASIVKSGREHAAPMTQVPEQIRLVYTNSPTSMMVFWATSNKTLDTYVPTVQYGPTPDKLTLTVTGTNSNYTAFHLLSPSLHSAVATGLTPLQTFWYRVGDGGPDGAGWGPAIGPIRAAPAVGDKSVYPFSFLAYGDMGISNSEPTAALTAKMIQDGDAAFIVHAGDIAYADNRAGLNNGTFYDGVLNDFYNEISGASSRAPYMTSSGNHEAILGFLAYTERVGPTLPRSSPGATEFWYSWNYGPVHFVAFDQDQPWGVGSAQYSFIAADLAAVDRTVTPWVIAYNHFPLLCSNFFWCLPDATKFREVYDPLFNAPATKVDVHIAGHVHAAEVLYPNLNGTVVATNFTDMATTFHVMAGFPGDIEVCCNDWLKPAPAYSFWRDDDVASDGGFFGFSQFTVANDTHLNLKMWVAANATTALDLWVSRAAA